MQAYLQNNIQSIIYIQPCPKFVIDGLGSLEGLSFTTSHLSTISFCQFLIILSSPEKLSEHTLTIYTSTLIAIALAGVASAFTPPGIEPSSLQNLRVAFGDTLAVYGVDLPKAGQYPNCFSFPSTNNC
jgi:hypothetical protein